MKPAEQSNSKRSEEKSASGEPSPAARFIGIDVGAETVKLVELVRVEHGLRIARHALREHCNKPGDTLKALLASWDFRSAQGAAVCGRFAPQVNLRRIPAKQAQLRGYRFLFGEQPATIINIGSHGFSVLEMRGNGLAVFRENSRCSQGTGNFLRQLVERFSLTVEEASRLCVDVRDPAPLSGRCPVILKTDMTHLANKGEERARILAGLFDAVCENVLVLLRPGVSPPRVLLVGGVSRSERVRRVFTEKLAAQQMELVTVDERNSLCLEAMGCAILAAEAPEKPSDLNELVLAPRQLKLERLPALAEAMGRVRRMPACAWPQVNGEVRRLVLGFDIGSTGAKLVAMDVLSHEVLWEEYRQTLGDPVGATQALLKQFASSPLVRFAVVAFGATGSGREVAGSLLNSCYGKEAVFVVNEIVAHATGALHYDQRVDTIFEIGGQDAKYIRLAEGRIIDCAMNEACSAGTGSFIEEQGRKFAGMQDVRLLGQAALAAESGVSLGQHCSVFMAEVIDEGVGAGIETGALISGLYDSIIKNYLNRVKGNRSVGKVIFCQGMPFSADALAAAVARQTGSEVVIPPNPGTVGALGIALLAARDLAIKSLPGLDLTRFLSAKVEQKDSFVCRAKSGCGGAGNRCRIERLRTLVREQSSMFTWGGGCALHDKATRKRKLPDLAPDPFREREELLQEILAPLTASRGNPRVAFTDEFILKGLFPFFGAFLHDAGFDLVLSGHADQATLKRGVQCAAVPFCAPMQLFHGVADRMAGSGADFLFIPMLRSLPRSDDQRCSVVCPILQAAPDVLRCALASRRETQPANHNRSRTEISQPTLSAIHRGMPCAESSPGFGLQEDRRHSNSPSGRILSPRIDFGEGGLESKEFLASCRRLGKQLGLRDRQWHRAWRAGKKAQDDFDAACERLGARALEFCRKQNLVPVVVLGRNYTIHNTVLNSNVPAILREQGAIGIPVDCYPLGPDSHGCSDMYWGYGNAVLRAAHQVRRAWGVYALYCSNYSCGPDSFNLHVAAYAMEGKPFAIIETDGHSGDAGTKTRVEAFLHCVEEHRQASSVAEHPNELADLEFSGLRLREIGRKNGATEKLLIPALGRASEAVAAVFRGIGFSAEALPAPDTEALRLGRRYTSGKECLPMPLTLGTLLQRLAHARNGEKFVYVMPGTDGPCRFGVYNLLNQIVLERLGWRERLRIWSPKDNGYFDDLPAGTEMLMLAGIVGTDLLFQALLDVRPFESEQGRSNELYESSLRELMARLETAGKGDLSLAAALWQVTGGRLFGIKEILGRAAAEFSKLRGPGDRPMVEVTGEIYVRSVHFSNDFLIEKLENRGLRAWLAPQSEWLNYCSYIRRLHHGRNKLTDRLSEFIQHRIELTARAAMAPHLGWRSAISVTECLAAAEPFVSSALEGEAALTVGGALESWRRKHIDAVISVGPFECMPTKIAEAQLRHLAERGDLLSLTLAFNGEPPSEAMIDNFAFEVHERFRRKHNGQGAEALPVGSMDWHGRVGCPAIEAPSPH